MEDKTREYEDGFKKAKELCEEKMLDKTCLELFVAGYKKGFRDGYIHGREDQLNLLRSMRDQSEEPVPQPWPKFPWW
jgi:hypothetical protein